MQPFASRSIAGTILCVLSLIFLFQPAAADERAVRIAIEPWAPYADEDLPGRGFLTRLTEAAFEAAGYDPVVEFIPWARALYDVEHGYRDVLMGLFYSDERNEVYRYSEPVYQAQVGLVARSGFELDAYASFDDLVPYTIGIGRGFANSPDFDAAVEEGMFNVDVATEHGAHIRMLFADRIDMLAGTVDIIMHLAREQGFAPEDMKVLEPPLMTHDIHIGVSRALDDSARIRDDFNEGLAIIHANGVYDEILARYAPDG